MSFDTSSIFSIRRYKESGFAKTSGADLHPLNAKLY